jgi:hypothetical protein
VRQCGIYVFRNLSDSVVYKFLGTCQTVWYICFRNLSDSVVQCGIYVFRNLSDSVVQCGIYVFRNLYDSVVYMFLGTCETV